MLGDWLSMCLNHDFYFFCVSSLVYPNLLGKKGYVVVVNNNYMLAMHKEDDRMYSQLFVGSDAYHGTGGC